MSSLNAVAVSPSLVAALVFCAAPVVAFSTDSRRRVRAKRRV